MNRARWSGLWVAIAALLLVSACGPKHIELPVRPGQSLTVLLPDSDTNKPGAAKVSNPQGAVDLDESREAALATTGRAPIPGTLTEAQVNAIFGDALSAMPPAPRRFTLFFEFGESDVLTAESRALIPEILSAVKQHVVQDVVVIGHTDTMGTQRANYDLGLKRAIMVRDLLVGAGLESASIDVTSVGELDPVVKTPDETREPRNRRVDIAVR